VLALWSSGTNVSEGFPVTKDLMAVDINA